MAYTDAQRAILKLEITSGTSTMGYTATMTDAQVRSIIVADTETRAITIMSGDAVFQQTDQAEFTALADGSATEGAGSDKQGHWIAFCSRDEINAFATANEDFVSDIFGTATQTITNLKAARKETVSRADLLGIPDPTEHQVSVARS